MNCLSNTAACSAIPISSEYIDIPGIYRIDAQAPQDIRIAHGVNVHLFDATTGVKNLKRTITLETGANLVICGYIYDADYEVEILSAGEECKADIAYLLVSIKDAPIVSRISSLLQHSHTQSNVHIVSFAAE